MGLRGWQWLFLVQGLPTILLGIAAFFYLDDNVSAARWLTSAQKRWLEGMLAPETVARDSVQKLTIMQALRSPIILALSIVYFGLLAGVYGIQFWLPQIVKGFGLTNVETGFVSALPFAFGTIAMLLWGRNSDKHRERKWHIVLPLVLTTVALIASAFVGEPVLTLAALVLASIGALSAFGLFWTVPTAMLTGAAAAGGIALINSIGSLAGFGGPYLIGWVKELTGSTITGLSVLAVLPAIAAVILLVLARGTGAPHVLGGRVLKSTHR